MQPHLAKKIEKQTRKNFPNGIPAFGTDALRFTFAALATTGRDIVLSLDRLEGYRNFCNKIWNAARYVLMNTEDQDCGQQGGEVALSSADRWIISRLQETEQQIIRAIEGYRFDHMAQTLYEFTWNEYCDWYLELSKPVLHDPASSAAALRGTRQTLVQVLETLLRLAHPVMPFLTEEIWQRIAPLAGVSKTTRPTTETIMLQPWPQPEPALIDTEAVAEIEWVRQFILGVRKIRSSMDIKPGKLLPVLLQNGSEQDRQRLAANLTYLKNLGRIESIQWLEPAEDAPESATALVGDMKLLIPMAGLIDKQAELARLGKEIDKLQKEIRRLEGKLGNAAFIAKAPAEVVDKERHKLAEYRKAAAQLQEQRARIEKL